MSSWLMSVFGRTCWRSQSAARAWSVHSRLRASSDMPAAKSLSSNSRRERAWAIFIISGTSRFSNSRPTISRMRFKLSAGISRAACWQIKATWTFCSSRLRIASLTWRSSSSSISGGTRPPLLARMLSMALARASSSPIVTSAARMTSVPTRARASARS
ncbi:MAG: hypothetical protein NUV77_22510 [Thermoguttaceae bacterium]|nr:hypothetical protein [Thermoguttaceae bacterium]